MNGEYTDNLIPYLNSKIVVMLHLIYKIELHVETRYRSLSLYSTQNQIYVNYLLNENIFTALINN